MPSGATLLDIFKRFPETNRPLIEFHEALLRGSSPFTEAERELIAAYVSGLNRCRYCRGVHTATAERLGVEKGVNREARGRRQHGGSLRRNASGLYIRAKVDGAADGVTKADADAVFSAGWDETALYYLVATTALFNYMNRLVEGLGVEFDPAYTDVASKRLDGGYLPLLRLMERP